MFARPNYVHFFIGKLFQVESGSEALETLGKEGKKITSVLIQPIIMAMLGLLVFFCFFFVSSLLGYSDIFT